MFGKTDTRLGGELGLPSPYEDLPAFQIVNDAHVRVAALTSRIITLKYGGEGGAFRNNPRWEDIEQKKLDFVLRANDLGGDAAKAAQLTNDIGEFLATVFDRFLADEGDAP